MSVCLLVIDDGREDYLDRCLASAAENLPPMDATVMVADPDHELGFAGAVQAGWEGALETGCDHVFHLESDFVFNRPVPIADMAAAVAYRHLVQMALLRQPWNDAEKDAGGLIALDPDLYERHFLDSEAQWLEHREYVTTNPALWPRWVIERGWPLVKHSEGHFGLDLFADDRAHRAAYWGNGDEWVEHIGVTRTGTGY